MVQENGDAGRRFIGSENPRRFVDTDRIRERLVICEVRQIKSRDELVEVFCRCDPEISKQDRAVLSRLLEQLFSVLD